VNTPKSEWFVRVRTYAGGGPVDVWLLEKTGVTIACLLHGSLLPARAELLCAHLESCGLRIEREESPWELRQEGPPA
jgi:hypothetical protein